MISQCSRCTARFADQLGLVWHYRAAHEDARAELEDPMTEIKTPKSKILAGQPHRSPDSPDERPWVAALVVGALFLAAGLGALISS